MVGKLRGEFRLRNAQRTCERVEEFQAHLDKASNNPNFLEELHSFNDWVQRELIGLTSELALAFFGQEKEPPSAGKAEHLSDEFLEVSSSLRQAPKAKAGRSAKFL